MSSACPAGSSSTARTPSTATQVLPPAVTARVSVEEASTLGWDRYVGSDGVKIGHAHLRHLGAAEGRPNQVRLHPRPGGRSRKGAALHEADRESCTSWARASGSTTSPARCWTTARSRGYIEELSVTGLTSNPTIFDKAISGGDAYDEQIAELSASASEAVEARPTERIFFELALADLRGATDLFAGVHERTDGVDGFVLARGLAAARRRHRGDDRAGRRAARQGRARQPLHQDPRHRGRAWRRSRSRSSPASRSTSRCCSTREQYLAAADAYMKGIERRIEAGLDPDVASVASLFISRWDVAVAGEVPRRAAQPARHRDRLAAPTAPTASCSTRARWQRLMNEGARAAAAALGQHRDQGPRRLRHPLHRGASPRPSRSTRCPSRPCTPSPITARSASRCPPTAATPRTCWPSSATPGIDVDALAKRLQDEGAEAFVKSWDEMLKTIESQVGAHA